MRRFICGGKAGGHWEQNGTSPEGYFEKRICLTAGCLFASLGVYVCACHTHSPILSIPASCLTSYGPSSRARTGASPRKGMCLQNSRDRRRRGGFRTAFAISSMSALHTQHDVWSPSHRLIHLSNSNIMAPIRSTIGGDECGEHLSRFDMTLSLVSEVSRCSRVVPASKTHMVLFLTAALTQGGVVKNPHRLHHAHTREIPLLRKTPY